MEYLVNKITKEHKVFKPGTVLSGVSIKDWKFVYANEDGWIPWDGEEDCPVPKDQHVEYCMLDYGVDDIKNPEKLRWRWQRDRGTNIVTYRPILNTEPKSVNWDGEGLPPVGALCYYVSNGTCSRLGEITYHPRNGGTAIIEYENGGFDVGNSFMFKPLESERELWVNNVSEKLYNYDLAGNISADETAKFLYDSIVSGEIPIPLNKRM